MQKAYQKRGNQKETKLQDNCRLYILVPLGFAWIHWAPFRSLVSPSPEGLETTEKLDELQKLCEQAE